MMSSNDKMSANFAEISNDQQISPADQYSD